MYTVRAQARYVGLSAQKARRIVNMVRGRPALEALNMLNLMPHLSARPVAKLLRTAIADAEENFELDRNDLVVQQAYADEGPRRKWRRFGARGRFKPLLRRSTHITIVLAEEEGAADGA